MGKMIDKMRIEIGETAKDGKSEFVVIVTKKRYYDDQEVEIRYAGFTPLSTALLKRANTEGVNVYREDSPKGKATYFLEMEDKRYVIGNANDVRCTRYK